MSALQIIRDIEAAGAEIFIHNGGLRLVAIKGKVTPSMHAKVKEKKAEIIDILSLTLLDKNKNDIGIEDEYQPEDKQVPGKESKDLSVVGCNPAREFSSPILVPDLCRDCPRLEIVNIMGTDVPGCFYTAPREYSDGWRRIPKGSRKCIRDSFRLVDVHSILRSSLTSESGLDGPGKRWVEENRQVLHDAGFTDQDLYGENPVGISKLILFQKPGLEIHLDGGEIRFTWPGSAGKMITQTCTPERRRRCDS